MITADELYALADSLKEPGYGSFMCCAFSDLFGWSRRRREFEPLLRRHGVSISGALMPDETLETEDCVRFMFLEFLALDRS